MVRGQGVQLPLEEGYPSDQKVYVFICSIPSISQNVDRCLLQNTPDFQEGGIWFDVLFPSLIVPAYFNVKVLEYGRC